MKSYLTEKKIRYKIYNSTPEGAYKAYFNNSKNKEQDFTLTKEEVWKICCSPCHYCGHEEKRTRNGIDRRDSSVGYVLNNCLPCCKICNRAKHSLSYEDFKFYLDKLKKFLNSRIEE